MRRPARQRSAGTTAGPATPRGLRPRDLAARRARRRELGVNPRAIVAQAALETGWGSRQIRDDARRQRQQPLRHQGRLPLDRRAGDRDARSSTKAVYQNPSARNFAPIPILPPGSRIMSGSCRAIRATARRCGTAPGRALRRIAAARGLRHRPRICRQVTFNHGQSAPQRADDGAQESRRLCRDCERKPTHV